MPYEDRKTHERHIDRIFESLKPEGHLELDLAQAIADDKWRLNRARAIEENLFAVGAENCPIQYPDADERGKAALTRTETFLRFAKEFQLLTLYESHINRNVKNNMAELTRLQTERETEQARQLEEAALLAELAESKGETWDPASLWEGPPLLSPHDAAGNPRPRLTQNGFAFSTPEIARCRRLQIARSLLHAGAKKQKAASLTTKKAA
jgi:hypothetical protein